MTRRILYMLNEADILLRLEKRLVPSDMSFGNFLLIKWNN